ncbi:hypothetical protein CBR_g26286 [Chara braunii]|uniref:SANT domain-containing protein n=1 Tax=Chara braunii TaxID=69332 RepID=A0A388L7J8_CHABU|nr:hypothetical protein CBR_g26286 [Chara braunii]|eukprot:GBG78254.1 hypothetical protein CBR_g26286 [Chara braunii]
MPLKRKLSDRLGPPWTKEDIAEFLQGFRAHGQDWKKVASLVRNRTVEMVAALYTMNRAYLSLPEVSVDALFAMMTDHCNFMQEGCLSNGDVSSGDEIESRSSSQKKKKIGNGGNAGAPAGVLVPGKKGGSTPSKRGALSESFKLKEKDKGLKVVMQKEKEKEKEEKKDEKEEKKDEKKDEKKEKEKEVVKEIKPGATPSLGLPMGLTGTPGRRPTGRRTPRGPFSGMTAEKEREREERGKEEREKEEKEKEEEEEEEKDVEKENKRERLGKREKLKDKEGEKERVRLKEFERDQKVSDRENRREERESQRLKEKESLKQKERENQRLKEKDSQRVKDREREKEEREKESVKESVKEKVKEREKERERERDKEKKEESSRDKERDAERKKFEKEKKSNKVRDKDREVAGNPTASPENRRGSRGDGGQGNKDKASRDKEKVKEKEKPKAKDKVKPKDKLPESSKSEKETVREPVSPSHSTRKLQRTRQGEVKARPIVENAGAVPVRKTDGEAMTSSNGTVKGGAAEVGIGAKRTSDRSESTPKRENARSTPRKLVSKSLKDGATAGKGSEVSERRRGALFESNEVSPEQVVARERSGGTTSTAAVVAGCGASTRKQTHSPGEEDVDMEPDSSSREGGVGNENTKKKSLRRTKSVNVSLDISRGGEGSVGPAAIASPQGRKGGGTGEREEKMARKLVDDAGPEGNAKRARRQDKEKVRDRAVERVKKEQALIQEEKEEGEVDEEADEESKREGDDHVDTREEVEEPRRKRKTPMAPQQDSKKFRGMYSGAYSVSFSAFPLHESTACQMLFQPSLPRALCVSQYTNVSCHFIMVTQGEWR